MRRKLVLVLAAVLMPVVSAVSMGAGPASANANVIATGNDNCTGLTGTIKFVPPLTNNGGSAETATIHQTATGCTGGSPAATKIIQSATVHLASNSCGSLAGASIPLTLKETYQPTTISSSTLKGSATGTAGTPVTFDTVGTVTAGSYKSAANSTKVHAVVKQSLNTLATECSTTGISSITISSGTVTNN